MLDEFKQYSNIYEVQYKVEIEILSWLDEITIIPKQNEFSNENILNGFINLCIKILNEIMQRRKEQEEEEKDG
jgi:hypothetical protein